MLKQESLDNAKIVGSPIVHKVCLFMLLFAFWMALVGTLKTKFVIYGIVTAATTVWMCYPLLLVPNKDGGRKYFVFGISIFKFISYSIWLMWQLVLANIDVLKATTSQNLDIDPKVVRFYFKVDNPMAYVVLANSITLTPGTVTLNVTDDGLFEIHSLTVGAAEGVLDGSFQKKVADLYGIDYEFAVVEEED